MAISNFNTMDMFWIFFIRKVRLRNSKPKSIKDKKRIMILCFILQERIDNILSGGRIDNNIFSLNDPVWG